MEEGSLWDILLEAGLTEDQIEEIVQMGALEGQGSLAEQQYEQAQKLRRTPWPQGRWAGRVYRKAHPLEHISAGVDRTMGSIEAQKQLDRQEQILADQARLRGAFLGHFLKNRQNPPATATPTPMGAMSPVPVGMGNPAVEALRNIGAPKYQLR